MDLLLQTKLAAPVIRDRLVARARLFQRLEEGLLQEAAFQRRLTLVAAPAGYGKTTLVAGWLRQAGRPFAWLSLDETDNDPSRFLAYLLAALRPLGVGGAAGQALQSPQPPPVEAVLSILLNEISQGRPFTLVLDDYHCIHTAQIHQMLAFFLDHAPPAAHLVVITREDPLLPVPRLRARGQALEIRQEDLRFTAEETGAFLREVMDLGLDAQDVAALEQRTEGWVAGLQLAALAVQGYAARRNAGGDGAGTHDFIRAFAGSSRFVIDYLFAEVFQQQPAGIQEFLLKTAVLERMCGPLCDELTGQGGSQSLLEHLEQANLFIIPLDQEGEWFRYHHLFAGFLRHRLRTQSAQEVPALHQAAGRWLAANGWLTEAVEHALLAPDWELAGALIEQARDGLLRRGEIVTLLGWYRLLPEALLRSRPVWCLGYAWPLLLSGHLDLAEALLKSAEPMLVEGSPDQGNFYALHAYLARSRGDHDAVIPASEKALALLGQVHPAIRGTLALNLGIAYWHSGRLDETERTMAEVQREAAQTNNRYALLTAGFFRARTLACRGLLRQSEPLLKQVAQDGGQSPIAALAHYDLCTLYIEWDRLEEAEQRLEQGMALSAQMNNAEFMNSGHILRAMVHLARGDYAAALAEAGQAHELARGYPVGVQARSEALHVQVCLAMGDVAQAAQWAEQKQAAADAHPLYRFLDLTRPRLLIAQGKKEEAQELLDAGIQAARERGWGYGLAAALALRALAGGEAGVELLDEALRMAEPQGFLRTFLDAGPGLAPLLREAARRGACPEYAGRILAKSGAGLGTGTETTAPAALSSLVEPLSERELEVLRLVAAGLSNREIARQLYVTPGTAKTHIHHICGKLAVRNRTEAAMRAKELGLV